MPGTTYLFQVAQLDRRDGTLTGPVEFELALSRKPEPGFQYDPADPSSLDTISFLDQSVDPEREGFASRVWDFGDGTTLEGRLVSHRYAADGDYRVRLTVETWDGRRAKTTGVVRVRTHDVSVSRVVAPATARTGQTIKVTVQVRNTRIRDTVQIDLSRSAPEGFSPVGSLTKKVPVSRGDKTTPFVFDYTLTEEDRAAGTITFRADATLVGARDVAPTDNSLVSAATSVS